MASELIADRVGISRRYVRAVDMARDLSDPEALSGYVMTPPARDSLMRILAGLKPNSSQRAFRITGPYGSGKSSFGLLLARLLLEKGKKGGPAQVLTRNVVRASAVPPYYPVVLVGRRASLSDDLLQIVADTAVQRLKKPKPLIDQVRAYQSASDPKKRDVKIVLDLLSNCAQCLREETGQKLLLLVDEMGRYLEFAAANPDLEDPSIFQLLAERAGGASKSDLAVIGFLHHRFGDYVATLGDWMEGEWARSSERYEEIAFHETSEQTLHLLTQALSPEKAHTKAIIAATTKLYKEAGRRNLFAGDIGKISDAVKRLYPLHPAAIACLISSSRRFGQNERSLFSFLQSSEPAGFQRFSREIDYDAKNWYKIDNLFDYLASQDSFRFQSKDRERRWQLAQDALLTNTNLSDIETRTMKGLGLLAVLEPVPGLSSDADTLSWSLGLGKQCVADALKNLVKRGVAHRRSAQQDFSLWSNSSVDLDHWMEEARLVVSQAQRLDEVVAALPQNRPLVAQRHYHSTGTLRTFSVAMGKKPPAQNRENDGVILVMPVYPDEQLKKCKSDARKLSTQLGSLGIVHLHDVTPSDIGIAHDLACWKWVRLNCHELRIDDLARSEVERRIRSCEALLRVRIAPFADIGSHRSSGEWFYDGQLIEVPSRAALNRHLSTICDDVFSQAPRLRNELINRDKLSSAVAAARMRLLSLMLTDEGQDYLGLEGAPPERTIYLSMFRASDLHRSTDGGSFAFMPPTDNDPDHWKPAWNRVDALVKGSEMISYDALIKELGEAPIGLRAGPALLLVAAYMINNRATVALMERNSFQPDVSPAHFMRLAKSPRNFALRQVIATDNNKLLHSLSVSLSIWSENPPLPELKPVTEALYGWWNEVSYFAKSTLLIDKQAQAVRGILRKAGEPIELLFERLPAACGAVAGDEVDLQTYADALDASLLQMADALPMLRKRAETVLLKAFGARSTAKLRQQIRLQYEDHLLKLGSYDLRAFVDRTMNEEHDDEIWLDGIAGLIVGKRLDSWDDTHLDSFAFEIRDLAQRLARRLSVIHETIARAAPITAVHLTGSDGKDASLFVHDGIQSDKAILTKVKKLLEKADRPDALLVSLLSDMVAEPKREKIK